MKKLLVILLLLTYGLSATGATVHLHYCCGKLDKISFSTEHNEDCPEKENAAKNCCDSKKVDLKIEADQEPLAKWLLTHKVVDALPPSTANSISYPLNNATLSVFTTGPPAWRAAVPLYIQNRVFRI